MRECFTASTDADGICTLVMDQPDSAVNVMDLDFIAGFRRSVETLWADDAVKGIILTSAKSSFIAGADLKTLEHDLSRAQDAHALYAKCWEFSSLLRRLETAGKPVVAALNGAALGGGFEIALACHYRVAADLKEIRVGLPEVGVGLLPGAGGTQRYLRMLGAASALPLLLQGRQLDVYKARELGLIDAVTAPGELLATARQWLLNVGNAVKPWDQPGFSIPGGSSPLIPALAQLFVGTAARLQATTFQNFPAPLAIASCVYEGMQLPMDTALKVECKYFVKLYLNPVAGSMVRTLFIHKGKADRLIRRPPGIAPCQHRKIGVIGAGLMGAGIALTAARCGLEVILIDRDQASAERGKAHAQKQLARDLEKGRTRQAKADQVLARIHPGTDYQALRDVSLVVEAVFEERAVKVEVFAKAEAVMPASAVLASNTSALPISGLAAGLQRPDNMIGLHFFSPVERMPLVEVIRGRETSDQCLAHALDLVAQLHKTPILVNDQRGFFTSRFIGAFINEGVAMLAEGIHPALIENAAKLAGYPLGPLSISDEVGLDLAVKGAQQARQDLGKDYQPGESSAVFTQLVACGRHGRKNGQGFYDYPATGGKQLWPGLNDLWPRLPGARQPDADAVRKRLIFAQLVDAAHCFADGVLEHPADGDLGACLGVGFPLYLGGPFAAMDTFGLDQVIAQCAQLAQGNAAKRFRVPSLLHEMAARGQTFYGEHPVRAS